MRRLRAGSLVWLLLGATAVLANESNHKVLHPTCTHPLTKAVCTHLKCGSQAFAWARHEAPEGGQPRMALAERHSGADQREQPQGTAAMKHLAVPLHTLEGVSHSFSHAQSLCASGAHFHCCWAPQRCWPTRATTRYKLQLPCTQQCPQAVCTPLKSVSQSSARA